MICSSIWTKKIIMVSNKSKNLKLIQNEIREFRMKLLNSGVVNHYWPISPTFQILCISDPDLAHFVLNLRPVFESTDLLKATCRRD